MRQIITILSLFILTACGQSEAAILAVSASGATNARATLDACRTDATAKECRVTSPATSVTTAIDWTGGPELTFAKGSYVSLSGSGAITGLKESMPEWFGAKCDNATNDTVALSGTINAALQVLMPSGKTCVGHITMRDGQTIWGYGSTLKSPDGSNPTITANVNNATILGLNVVGFGSGSADIGIRQTTSSSALVMRDIFAQNYGEESVDWHGLAAKIDNLLAYNTALNHISDTSGKHCAVNWAGTDGTLENSEIGTSVQTFGFNSHLVRGALCIPGANNFIRGNQLETSDFGSFNTGYWNKFVQNRADLNGAHGFIESGVGALYVANHGHNNSLSGNNTYDDFIATGSNSANFVGNLAANTTHQCLTGINTWGGTCYSRYAYNNDTGYLTNFSQNTTQWPGGTTTALYSAGAGTAPKWGIGGEVIGMGKASAYTIDPKPVSGFGNAQIDLIGYNAGATNTASFRSDYTGNLVLLPAASGSVKLAGSLLGIDAGAGSSNATITLTGRNAGVGASSTIGVNYTGALSLNNVAIPALTGSAAVSAGGSTNHAVCWKSDGRIGYCSAGIAGDGTCGTCN